MQRNLDRTILLFFIAFGANLKQNLRIHKHINTSSYNFVPYGAKSTYAKMTLTDGLIHGLFIEVLSTTLVISIEFMTSIMDAE
jgi:hypothetical protein